MKCFMSTLFCAVLVARTVFAQDAAPAGDASGAAGDSDHSDLAKQSQNPLSSLISVPYASDFNFNSGPDNRTQYVGTFKPVYPVTVGNWNLVSRAILPLINQPVGSSDEEFGLGDLNYSLFFSPADPGKWIWGVGPTVTLPTATDDVLGSGKFSAGPTAIALSMPGQWVIGGLVSQQWSFAGEGGREDVNSMAFQYFVNYNLKKGWSIKSTPTILANWEASSSDTWTVPFGGGVGKVFKIKKQPFSAALQLFYNVERPDDASDWDLQFTLTALFPKGKKGK